MKDLLKHCLIKMLLLRVRPKTLWLGPECLADVHTNSTRADFFQCTEGGKTEPSSRFQDRSNFGSSVSDFLSLSLFLLSQRLYFSFSFNLKPCFILSLSISPLSLLEFSLFLAHSSFHIFGLHISFFLSLLHFLTFTIISVFHLLLLFHRFCHSVFMFSFIFGTISCFPSLSFSFILSQHLDLPFSHLYVLPPSISLSQTHTRRKTHFLIHPSIFIVFLNFKIFLLVHSQL